MAKKRGPWHRSHVTLQQNNRTNGRCSTDTAQHSKSAWVPCICINRRVHKLLSSSRTLTIGVVSKWVGGRQRQIADVHFMISIFSNKKIHREKFSSKCNNNNASMADVSSTRMHVGVRCECGAHAENVHFADVRVSLQSQPWSKLFFIVSLLFSSTFFQQSLYNLNLKKRIWFIWFLKISNRNDIFCITFLESSNASYHIRQNWENRSSFNTRMIEYKYKFSQCSRNLGEQKHVCHEGRESVVEKSARINPRKNMSMK